MAIQGISHVSLTVSRFERCCAFYEALFSMLGWELKSRNEDIVYYEGGGVGVGIRRGRKGDRERFDQGRVGLHHLCLRAGSRREVDRLHHFLLSQPVVIVHPPEEGAWEPGYYSVLFEDPDGIRLEVNHVPG